MIVVPAGAVNVQPAREPSGMFSDEFRTSSAYRAPVWLASSGPIAGPPHWLPVASAAGNVFVCAHRPGEVVGLQAVTT